MHNFILALTAWWHDQEITIERGIDEMTGLRNMKGFIQAGMIELERAKRLRTPISLICMDIKGLNELNNTKGHDFGDKAIVLLSRAIKESTRIVDVAGRVHDKRGDEFAVLVNNNWFGAEATFRRILERFKALAYAELRVLIDLHFGIFTFIPTDKQQGEITIEHMLHHADLNMNKAVHSARSHSRERTVIFL
jgi:diguanylate cyclase (GGDEF)-like protein